MIKLLSEIRCENIDWVSVGVRVKKFREFKNLDYSTATEELECAENTLLALETGLGIKGRNSANIIFRISQTWDISLNWLLNGIGQCQDADPIELIPETLITERGRGIRKTGSRAKSEEGTFTDEVLEFVMAIDKYKTFNNFTFTSTTQIFELVLALGYRKSAPARIAPLGYIIEHQKQAERIKLKNEEITEDSNLRREKIYKNMRKRVVGKKGARSQKCRKQYAFTDPNGKEHKINNLPEFCRQNKLDIGRMYGISTGRFKQYKKWTKKSHEPR